MTPITSLRWRCPDRVIDLTQPRLWPTRMKRRVAQRAEIIQRAVEILCAVLELFISRAAEIQTDRLPARLIQS